MWLWFSIIAGVLIVSVGAAYVIYKQKPSSKTVVLDDIIGEKCTVIETVDNYAGCGLVRVKGTEWSARSVSEQETFSVGDVVTVVAIEGVKLICKKRT